MLRKFCSIAIYAGDFELFKAIIEGNFVQDLNIYATPLICSLGKAIKEKDIKPFKNSVFAKIFESKFDTFVGGQDGQRQIRNISGKDLFRRFFICEYAISTEEEMKDSKKFARKAAKNIYVDVPKSFVEEEKTKELLAKCGESGSLSDCKVFVGH